MRRSLCLRSGTVVLGLFVASKVLGMGPGEGRQGRGSSGKGQRWGSGRCGLLHPRWNSLSV